MHLNVLVWNKLNPPKTRPNQRFFLFYYFTLYFIPLSITYLHFIIFFRTLNEEICHAYNFVKKDKQLLLTETDEILILCNLLTSVFLPYLLSVLQFVLFSIFLPCSFIHHCFFQRLIVEKH